MENLVIMGDKTFLEKTLTLTVRHAMQLDIFLFRSNPYSHDSIGFKIYYFGTSILLGLVGCAFIVEAQTFLPTILISFLFLSLIIFNLYIYDTISNKRKIDLTDEFISRPAVLRKRKQLLNNFGFRFTIEQTQKIFVQLSINNFIDKETSYESFYAVFMLDFGHVHQVKWNTTLSQTEKILSALARYSKGFTPALAFRKKLFISNKGTLMNINSFNTAKKQRNKKNEEYFFKDEFLHFNDFLKRLIDENE